ncbi:BCCT family transporter, partial [Vibrio makurazakiensis]|uniref:BCCT family transporter n=1 Tax=Vibrio makurazakiensis TaxID=2910250 RepID=UPI003D14E537
MSDLTNVASEHLNTQATPPSYTQARSLFEKLELGNPVLWLSGSFLILFVIFAITNTTALSEMVNAGFSYSTKWFGAFWQVLLLLNFLIGLVLAIGRTGYVR